MRDVTAAVDALMREYDGAVPGASVLVIRDGRPVVRRAYGLANLEEQIPATTATNYRLASVTKQFTAAAILILAEEGRLTLDERIRQLLTHTTGITDYEDLIPPGTTAQLSDADVERMVEADGRTYFAPGTSYRYSNSGYALLARIAERASGMTFAAYLRERIFLPLGMSGTVAGLPAVNRAFGYSFIDGRWQRTDQSLTSAVLGDGGIYSSIDDLAKWDAVLYGLRFAAAFAPATPTDDPAVQYGFGWRISTHRGQRMLWHSGETVGFRNVILRFPERRLTVVVLTNRNEPGPYATALAIADLH